MFTGKYPFEDESNPKKVPEKVMAGERPHIPSAYRESADPFDQALIKVIEMSWIQDPEKRATAREMQKFIISELERLKVKKDN